MPTRHFARLLALALTTAALLALPACGDDGSSSPSGVVTETSWASHCVATFTEDYDVIDYWGDHFIYAKTGDAYLMSGFRLGFMGEDTYELLYLTAMGTIEFEVTLPEGTAPPFTATCTESTSSSSVGVFKDTTVYANVELSDALCELHAGDVADSAGLSVSFAGDDLFASRPPYEVDFGAAFDAQCPGVTGGFVRANSYMLAGTSYQIVPIDTFLSPDASNNNAPSAGQ